MSEECRGYCDTEWLVHDDPQCPLYEGRADVALWDAESEDHEVEPLDTGKYVTMAADW